MDEWPNCPRGFDRWKSRATVWTVGVGTRRTGRKATHKETTKPMKSGIEVSQASVVPPGRQAELGTIVGRPSGRQAARREFTPYLAKPGGGGRSGRELDKIVDSARLKVPPPAFAHLGPPSPTSIFFAKRSQAEWESEVRSQESEGRNCARKLSGFIEWFRFSPDIIAHGRPVLSRFLAYYRSEPFLKL
jgi:hypothetical protein